MTVATVPANGIELHYETFGPDDGRPLLLIMGLGTQMIGWPDELCAALGDRGFRTIRYDNRDVGLSTHLHDARKPDLMAIFAGDTSTAAYGLEDMADDAAGLLDALGIGDAHIVGASMGGMIAQVLAYRHADRVRTLTSVMSSVDPRTFPPTPEASALLLRAPSADRDSYIAAALDGFRVIGSPGFEPDLDGLRQRAGLAWDRGYNPAGVARQLAAIYATGDRGPHLRDVAVPTLVVHGDADTLVPLPNGQATAAAIPGAELLVIAGMGHDLPRAVWPQLLHGVAALADRADAAVDTS